MSYSWCTRLLSLLIWQISAGELGTTVEKLEAQLPLTFQRADKWNAVLLDEADVFLEQRSLHDIHRNALVCLLTKTRVLSRNRVPHDQPG